MLRGCQKRIYYVKNPESDIFDEAYFILRRGAGMPHGRGGMTTPPSKLRLEAERLMADAGGGGTSLRRKQRRERLVAFLFGIASAAAILGAALLVVLK